MAVRPVFVPDDQAYVRTVNTEFRFYSGFSAAQKKRCAKSLHEAFLGSYPGKRILEVSSFSDKPLGAALSAFHLTIGLKSGERVPVEVAFQSGKVFENGGPYKDFLTMTPREVKRDPRLKNSGGVIGFEFEGSQFPTRPLTLFYTWLYLRALSENQDLAEDLLSYDAFTDIVFNPARQINCQAYACAVFVSLHRKHELERALQDPAFLAGLL